MALAALAQIPQESIKSVTLQFAPTRDHYTVDRDDVTEPDSVRQLDWGCGRQQNLVCHTK